MNGASAPPSFRPSGKALRKFGGKGASPSFQMCPGIVSWNQVNDKSDLRVKEMELYEIIDTIQKWVRTIQEKHREEIKIEFLIEQEAYLRYVIESTNYLAELVVEPEGFHPYRFVCFEILDKRKDPLQEPYCYLDGENSSIENIVSVYKGLRRFTATRQHPWFCHPPCLPAGRLRRLPRHRRRLAAVNS